MTHYMRSPLEPGEMDASPYHSPDIEIDVHGDSHISDDDSVEERTPRADEEEELGPEIKPPHLKVKKEKHKHKHKHEKRKSGDRSRDRRAERSDKVPKHSGRGVDAGRGREPKERGSGSRVGERPQEVNERDKRSRQVRIKEEEIFRREQSLKERERLEKLEMERRRLDREISRREQEQREKIQRDRDRERAQRPDRARKVILVEEDKRRVLTRQNVEKKREYMDTKYQVPSRSRSPPRRREPVDSYSQSGRSSRSDKFDAGGSRLMSVASKVEEVAPPVEMSSRQRSVQDEDERGTTEEVAESSEDSESDSDSSSDSESESGSSSEEEEEAESKKENSMENQPDRVKSRFDSESHEEDIEEDDEENAAPPRRLVEVSESDDDESAGQSERRDGRRGEYDDNYLDETPPQSPSDLPPFYPAIQGCRNVEEFNCLFRIEEGTYGVVYKARDKKTDEDVALKRLKMEKEKDGFPITSLREINTLLKAQHKNIVTVREIVVGSNMDRIYIVMDYVEHDLKALMERMKEPFMIGEVKTLMIQLLRGVAHLHDNWIIHRDLKTSNLLLSNKGILKIGDFGLAREYGSPLKHYTPIVVTLWYRSPELLLGTKEYACAIDMWSVGCIMAEFITRKPLFPGKSEIDELNRIFKELGTPNEKIWPGVSELKGWKTCTFADYPYNQLRNRFGGIITDKGFELMNRFLTYNPSRRITAEEGLKHEWFNNESPHPTDPAMFPTWPTKNEQSHHRGKSPKPPSGGKAYSSLLNDDDEKLGFHLPGVATTGGGFALRF